MPSIVASQLGSAIAPLLTSSLTTSSSSSTFKQAGSLLDALQTAADQQVVATAVAGSMAAALVGRVQQGSAPPEAASLLARLVKQFGAEVMTAAPAVPVPGAGHTTGMLPLTFDPELCVQPITANWQRKGCTLAVSSCCPQLVACTGNWQCYLLGGHVLPLLSSARMMSGLGNWQVDNGVRLAEHCSDPVIC